MTINLKKISEEGLTPQYVKALRDAAPSSKDELRDWIIFFLDVYLADQAINDGNSSPMDFVWDIYNAAIIDKEAKYRDFVGMAARSSQKTLSCAVLEFLFLLFDKYRDYIHLGAIDMQSRVCYRYVRQYADKSIFAKDCIESSKMSETVSTTGRRLVISRGTMNSVNAIHGSLILDEVDLMPKNIFNEARGMLTSTTQAKYITVCISSRKFAFGNMENLLSKSSDIDSTLKIHKWGLLEMTEPCPDERSGTELEDYYVDEERLIALTELEYKKEMASKDKFVKLQGYKNCGACGFFSVCKGRLKQEKKYNPYFVPIEDAVRFFKNDDIEFFKSQRMNSKPSKIGLIYPDFDPIIHLKRYWEMMEVFTGENYVDPPEHGDLPLPQVMKKFAEKGCKFFVGIDWGFTNPFVALLLAIDGQDRVYVIDHITTTGHSDAECVLMTARRWGGVPLTLYPDTENPSGIKELKTIIDGQKLPWFVSNKTIKDISLGIGITRNFLRIPGTTQTRLTIHHSVAILISEFKKYRKKLRKSDGEVLEAPEDQDNHALDALRYILATIFQRFTADLFSASYGTPIRPVGADKPLTATPAEVTQRPELNEVSNLTEEDLKNKIKSEEEKGFDSGGSGGGGFSWSF